MNDQSHTVCCKMLGLSARLVCSKLSSIDGAAVCVGVEEISAWAEADP